MSGQTSGQRQASRYTTKGVDTLKGAEQRFLLDPQFLAGKELGLQLANSPFSWTPEAIGNAKNSMTTNAYSAFNGQMDQIGETATAAQGFRSGTTMGQQRRAAQGLGDTIAQGNRAIDTQAALQRPQDIINAINAQLPALTMQYQWPRDIANIYAQQSTNPVWGQPSPLASAGQGVGALFGSMAGGGKF